jgi:single-strand DNA-binding protein
MPNYSKLIQIGHLTKEPELSYTPSQTAVVKSGIATNHKYTGKDGVKHDEVCFLDWVAFGKVAENLNKYLHKGDPVLLEGRLKLDQWTSTDGTKRSKHEMVVESFTFLPRKQDGATRPVGDPAKTPAADDPEIPF